MTSLGDSILRRINRGSPGAAFTRSDFFDLGSTHAIGMAIQRLVRAGKLRLVGYDHPQCDD